MLFPPSRNETLLQFEKEVDARKQWWTGSFDWTKSGENDEHAILRGILNQFRALSKRTSLNVSGCVRKTALPRWNSYENFTLKLLKFAFFFDTKNFFYQYSFEGELVKILSEMTFWKMTRFLKNFANKAKYKKCSHIFAVPNCLRTIEGGAVAADRYSYFAPDFVFPLVAAASALIYDRLVLLFLQQLGGKKL